MVQNKSVSYSGSVSREFKNSTPPTTHVCSPPDSIAYLLLARERTIANFWLAWYLQMRLSTRCWDLYFDINELLADSFVDVLEKNPTQLARTWHVIGREMTYSTPTELEPAARTFVLVQLISLHLEHRGEMRASVERAWSFWWSH